MSRKRLTETETCVNQVAESEDVDAIKFCILFSLLLPDNLKKNVPRDAVLVLMSELVGSEEGNEFIEKALSCWGTFVIGEKSNRADFEVKVWDSVEKYIGLCINK